MITLIICTAIGLIVGIIYQILDDEGLMASIVIGFVIGLIIGFGIKHETIEVENVVYLETINDNNNINGNFFLGSGNINGVWKYTYYYRDGDAYYLEQINANGVPIKYTDDLPRIEWIETVRTDASINKWSIRPVRKPHNFTIYIPKGSILQNYSLDAR